MGSKFLGTGSNDLSALQDGSFVLNVASANIQSLVPNMPIRASATRELVSGLIGVSDCSFTPLTNPVAGDLNMNNNSITNAQQIGLSQNSSPSTPSAGKLNVYNNGGNLRIIDSSSTIQTVATTANLAAYLPLAGGTMTGSINLGGQEITNCAAYRMPFNSSPVILGTSSTVGSDYCILAGSVSTIDSLSTAATCIGYGSTVTSSNASTAIGSTITQSASPGAVLVGSYTKSTNAIQGIAIGQYAETKGNLSICVGGYAIANSQSAVVIGNGSTSSASAANCIGYGLTNSTANSLLFDASVNMRSSSTTCDLGTTANPFQNLLLNGYARTSSVSKSIPCVRCTYSDSSFGFSLTTTETSIIDGTLSGSLTIPATTAAGFTMHMRAAWLYTAGAATTFTIRFKVGGTTILTTTIPAGTAVNQTIWAEHIIQLRSPNNRLFVSCKISRDAGTTIINSTIADSIWNPASSNAITATGQFSDTNGVWRGDSFSLDSSYAS